MLDRVFESLGSLGGPWAYAAVGLLAAGESSVGIGLVLPGETALVVGGFIVSQGNAEFAPMLAVAILGAIVGNSIGYEIGRRFGPRLRQSWAGRKIGEENFTRAEHFLAHRGGKAVAITQFMAVVRSVTPALAGVSKMPYRRFLFWNATGGIVWATIYVSLGVLAGRSYEGVADAAEGAGYVLLVLAVVVAAVLLAGRWVARHPERASALAERIGSWGLIAPLRARLAGPIRFVQRRFRIDSPFGLSLTLGMLFLVVTGWFLATVVADVTGRTDLVSVDRPLGRYLADHRVDWLTSLMRNLTDLGSTPFLVGLVALISIVWLVRTRRWGVVLFLAVSLAGALFLSNSLKELVSRPRPLASGWLVSAGGFSFPSGHATHATVVFGALAYLHGSVVRWWTARVVIWTGALLGAVLVGMSRIYLGVHWLTDVLGGFALGAVWLSIVTTTFAATNRLWRDRGNRHRRGPEPGDGGGQASSDSSRIA